MSGCDGKYRPETILFIERYCARTVPATDGTKGLKAQCIPYQLYMRGEGATRKDSIIKEELFMEHVYRKYNVLFVLDDRNQVVDKWREMGLTCFQVAPGNF